MPSLRLGTVVLAFAERAGTEPIRRKHGQQGLSGDHKNPGLAKVSQINLEGILQFISNAYITKNSFKTTKKLRIPINKQYGKKTIFSK
jgi:hypothetical protein